MKKLLSLALAAVMLLSCVWTLASCSGDDTATTTTTTTTATPGGPVTPTGDNLAKTLMAAKYKIVAPQKTTALELEACALVEQTINALSGKSVDVTDDFVKKGKPIPEGAFEILIGTTNRASSKASNAALVANRKNSDRDWQIIMKNNEVVICGATDAGTLEAAKAFATLLATNQAVGSYDTGITKYAWATDKLGGVAVEQFKIVVSADASEAMQTAAAALQASLYEASGFTLEIVTDATAQGANELVLGETTRTVSATAKEKLMQNRRNSAFDSIVYGENSKIALLGGAPEATVAQAAAFAADYLNAEKQASLASISAITEGDGVKDFKIDTTDVSYYTIVYAADADFDTRYVAYLLQQFLYRECGYNVKAITDATAKSGKEIRIGKTNRSSSTAMAQDAFGVSVDSEGNLLIQGGHYIGICLGYDQLLTAIKAQTGGAYTVAKTYTASGKVTDLPLNWNATAQNKSELKDNTLGNYTLVWNDEFNGTSINLEKWSGYGNMSMPDTTLSFDEPIVTVKDGQLIMKTDVTSKVNRTYVSNYAVTTHDTMNWSGGYLEMKAKIPFKGMGEWPSFWSSSANAVLFMGEYRDAHDGELYDAGYTVEVDFFEQFSSRDTVVPNLHKWFKWEYRENFGAPNRVQISGLDAGATVSGTRDYKFKAAGGKTANQVANDWHLYGFLWTPEYMAFSVDGEFYYSYSLLDKDQTRFNPTYKNEETGESKTFMMDGYTYDNMALAIILNDMFFPEKYCASEGGSWAASHVLKAENDDVFFPLMYYVEYMRLYQTEGDRLYTPDVIGQGTKLYDPTRFEYEKNGTVAQ